MPTKKAHGIHIAKMCEAFIESGAQVVLVVPARGVGTGLKEFYGLRVEVPTVVLPTIVLKRYKRLGYALMGASFMLEYVLYLWWRRLCGEKFILYTADIDSFAHMLLPWCGAVAAEFHSPKPAGALSRYFFRHAKIIATNALIAGELKKTFGVGALVEPNGVDESFFNLSGQGGGVLYVGRLYKWKGLEVLPAAHAGVHVIGGTKEEFESIFGDVGDLRFSEVEPAQVPAQLARADVLLLMGTAKNQESDRYTSPMKVFEYLATGKPTVASATQALKSLIPQSSVVWCAPDDPRALAEAIQSALRNPPDSSAGVALAREHTWRKRAERILHYV